MDVELENLETVLDAAFTVEVRYSMVVVFTTVAEVGMGGCLCCSDWADCGVKGNEISCNGTERAVCHSWGWS